MIGWIGDTDIVITRDDGTIAGGLVASHWILDLLMHRPDLPLAPGGGPTVGLGLWRSVPVTLALELGLLVAGVAIYLRATRSTGRSGSIGFWAMISLLVVAYFDAAFGPPPPSESALAWSGLLLWLFPLWGYWVDRRRAPA